MILRARYVLPMDQPPIEDGAVAIEGDTIVAVGKTADVRAAHTGEVRDVGERALAPGLINAHCHLDYTRLHDEVQWRGSFTEWLLQLVAAKQLHPEKEYLGGIQMGLDMLARSGTTTVVNIESFPRFIEQIPPPQLRVWWCLEMIDFNHPEGAREVAAQTLEFIAGHSDSRGGFGFSPHAPYTATAELYRLCAQYSRGRNIPLTTHLAESEEEDDMIRRGTGHMYDYFLRAGRDMSDCKRASPTQLLSECGVLGPNCLAAHANYLTPLDVTLLKQTGTHVVHCPKTHRFFGRGSAPAGHMERASDQCLPRYGQHGQQRYVEHAGRNANARPYVTADVSPGIVDPGHGQRRQGVESPRQAGTIGVGAWADLIAAPMDGAGGDPYEAIVYADKQVSFSMVGGKVVFDETQ